MSFKLFFVILFIYLSGLTTINFSYAVEPEEFLKDPKQELRARNLSKNVRCLVCQNESIDESSAPLAQDLRIIIRIKIKEGMILSNEPGYYKKNNFGIRIENLVSI